MRATTVWAMAGLVAVACAIPDVDIVSSFGDGSGGAAGSSSGGNVASAGTNGAQAGATGQGATSSTDGGTPGEAGDTSVGGDVTVVGGSGGAASQGGNAGMPTGTAGTGGNNSSAGSGGSAGNGGSSGSGGAGPVVCAGVVPPASISTFTTSGATTWGSASFNGSFLTYPGGALTSTVGAGVWRITGNVSTYSGIALLANTCANASSFSGVRFSIKGNAGGSGKMTFVVTVNSSQVFDGKKGGCVAKAGMEYETCHSPSKSIPVTASPQTVEVLWSELKGGAPADGTSGSDVVGFEWSFDWVFNDTPYSADVTIDNLEFF